MFRRILLAAGLIVFGLVISAVALIVSTADVDVSLGFNFPGRVVTARTDAWGLGGSNTSDTATIETGGYQIVVAPTNLSVDGNLCGTIDAATKSVEVTVQDDIVSFVADGRLVARYPR